MKTTVRQLSEEKTEQVLLNFRHWAVAVLSRVFEEIDPALDMRTLSSFSDDELVTIITRIPTSWEYKRLIDYAKREAIDRDLRILCFIASGRWPD